MYGKITDIPFEDGQHLWYETCFGNGKFILVVDKQAKYNVKDLRSKSTSTESPYFMIQMVDISEVKPIDIESHPEYYIREGEFCE